MIVTDLKIDDNPIIAANRQFEQLTGYTEDELIGRNCRILAGPETSRAHSPRGWCDTLVLILFATLRHHYQRRSLMCITVP